MLFFTQRFTRFGFLSTRRAAVFFCALTLCAALFSACAPMQNGASAIVSDTSAPPADDPAQGLVEEAPGRFAAITRKGVDELYTSERISDGAYSLLNSFLGGVSSQSTLPVHISAFKVTYDAAKQPPENALLFSFTVEDSQLDTLPPGDYSYPIFDGGTVQLNPGQAFPQGPYDDKPAVQYLMFWMDTTGFWNVPVYGNPYESLQSYEPIVGYLTQQVGAMLSVDEFVRMAHEQFGIEPTPELLAQLEPYIFLNDGIECVSAGGKGTDMACEVTDYREEGDVAFVTVKFYADQARLLPCLLVEYQVRADRVFLDYSTHNANDWVSGSPLNLTYGNFGESVRLTGVDALADYAAAHPETSEWSDFAIAFLRGDPQAITDTMAEAFVPGMEDAFNTIRIDPDSCVTTAKVRNSQAIVQYDVLESDLSTLPVGPHTSIISSGLARNSLNDSLDTPLCPSTLATNALTGILSCIGASMPAESDADPLSVLTLAGLARKDSMRTTGFTLEEVQSYAKTYLGVENLMPPRRYLVLFSCDRSFRQPRKLRRNRTVFCRPNLSCPLAPGALSNAAHRWHLCSYRL